MQTTRSIVSVMILFHMAYSLPNLQSEWKIWKKIYGKIYDTDYEDKNHFAIWKENHKYVINHNKKSDRGFLLEVNQFADQKIPRPSTKVNRFQKDDELVFVPKSQTAPASLDWRKEGVITEVINQGQAGYDQSIVAGECVESYEFINTEKLVSVSTTEIHDCCGQQFLATKNIFECIHNIGGVCSEADYPQIPGQCRNSTCSPAVQINGGMRVPVGNETALMEAVYKMPVMALIDASHRSFQLYRSGIYSEYSCKSTQLNHAVQIVGYGSIDGRDYRICKNSWGVNWGDRGYVLMARNKGNMCGIASYAFNPVEAKYLNKRQFRKVCA